MSTLRTNKRNCWARPFIISLSLMLTLAPCHVSADKAAEMQKLFMKAFAKKKVARPSQFTVDLNIDEQLHQSIKVFTNKQQIVNQVETSGLIDQLKSILKKGAFQDLVESLAKKERISFDSLGLQGIKATYDPAALSLNLRIKPDLREPLVLSLVNDVFFAIRKSNHIEPSNVSGYLNLYLNASLAYENQKSSKDLQFRIEGNLTVNKAILQSELTKTGDNWQVTNTHITHDEAHKLHRYRIGDVSSVGGHFQNSHAMKGFFLQKDFSLDKSLNIQPKASEGLVLSTRSDVVVYLNKHLLRRYTLAAGTYQFEDIGLRNGQNNIEIEIVDAFGKKTIQKASQLFDTRLLKPKLSKYAFSVGFLDNDGDELWIASGDYQYGLSDTLTIGGSGQLSHSRYLIASDALQVLDSGPLKTDFAISGSFLGEVGAALSLAFKPNKSLAKSPLSWEVGAEIYSKNFNVSLSDTIIPDDSITLRSGLQLKMSKLLLDHWQTSIGLSHNSHYNSDDFFSINLIASRRFEKGASLSISLDSNKESSVVMNAQFSIPLSGKTGRRKNLALSASTKSNTFEAAYEIKALNSIGKDSLSGAAIYRQSDTGKEEMVKSAIRFSGFESRFSASNRHLATGTQQTIQLGVNTSLACAGKECALSYPIEDSFALVGGPKNQKQGIALNSGNRRFVYSDDEDSILPQNYTALIKKAGHKAIIHLDDHHKQRIAVDEISLPFGYDPTKTEFQVFPKYHQGFNFNVGGEPGTIVDGILVDKDNKPLGFKGGQWVSVKNKDKAIAFFSNKAGRFRIPSISPGQYSLDLHDYPSMQTVVVSIKNEEKGIQNVGNITIHLE